MFHRDYRTRGARSGYDGLTREPVTYEDGRRRKLPSASLWERAKPRADRVPLLVSVTNRASMTNTFLSAAAQNSWASVFGPNADHGSFSQSCHRFAVVPPRHSYSLNRRKAAACRRHIGQRIMDGAERLRCSRPLRVFVVSHDTMPIALSPRLRRPCLLAFWRQPMGGSVPLKTVAPNYFPRRARPFGACARLLAGRCAQNSCRLRSFAALRPKWVPRAGTPPITVRHRKGE